MSNKLYHKLIAIFWGLRSTSFSSISLFYYCSPICQLFPLLQIISHTIHFMFFFFFLYDNEIRIQTPNPIQMSQSRTIRNYKVIFHNRNQVITRRRIRNLNSNMEFTSVNKIVGVDSLHHNRNLFFTIIIRVPL